MDKSKLRFLEWDSGFFGRKIFRYDLNSIEDLQYYYTEIIKSDAELAYVFSTDELDMEQRDDFFLADAKVTFSKTVSVPGKEKDETAIAPTDCLTRELVDLALLAGAHSRFKTDTLLADKFEDLYTKWIEKSLAGQLADIVFEYKHEDRTVGFVTVKKYNDSATIGLIATNLAIHGKGVGSSLISRVESWCLSNGVSRLAVATQRENYQACRFYEKNGFAISTIEYIYHHHISKQPAGV